jgi:hypothetical protein
MTGHDRLARAILYLLALVCGMAMAGCGTREAPPAHLQVEVPDLSCPAGPPAPPAPKPPRTLEAIVRYAYRLDEALVRSEQARAECARRLARVREYLDESALGGGPVP